MSKEYRKHRFFGFSSLAFIFILCILSILFLKNFTLAKDDTFAYLYSLIVTTFIFLRVTTSFFYKCDNYKPDNNWKDDNYEPTVSFMIPVKNEEAVIADTIAKCYAVDYPKEKIEVVVINDGSTDNTIAEIQKMKEIHPELTVIDWKVNKGKRYAMAEGFKMAKGEIVINLDSDSYLEGDSLRALVRPFQDPAIAGISAHTDPKNQNENILTKMQVAYYFISFRIFKAYESTLNIVFCLSGCCAAFRKCVILPVLDTWKDEKFLSRPVPYGDDRSLTSFIIKSGYKTIYLDNVQAYTIVPNNLKQFVKQQVRWKKSWIVCSIVLFAFMFKRDKFVTMTYLFPLVTLSFLEPFIAIKALILNPLVYGIYPTFYIIGLFLVTCLLALYYQFFKDDKNWKYIFVWTFLGMIFISYLIFYAIFDIKNTKWGTR